MAKIAFELVLPMPFLAKDLWRALTDWRDHARWIPATKVWITKPGVGPGVEFVARSGVLGLAVDDRMRVIEQDPAKMRAVVEKFGKPLAGTAGFEIRDLGTTSELLWFEDIEVKYLPKFLERPVTIATEAMFKFAMQNLKRKGLKELGLRALPDTEIGRHLLNEPTYFGLNFEVTSAEELKSAHLFKFLKQALDIAARHPITVIKISFENLGIDSRLHLSIKTADRQSAHKFIEEFRPISRKHELQSLGGDLESVHNRFGTVDFTAIAPNE
jgi:carbon monoxide dehydrogenase subunit G